MPRGPLTSVRTTRTKGQNVSVVEPAARWEPNLYAEALVKVTDQVRELFSAVGGHSGAPLRFVTEDITRSWTAAGSRARKSFLEDLHGADVGWRSAVATLGEEAEHAAAGEALWIDVANDPRQAWKTREMHAAPVSRGRAV